MTLKKRIPATPSNVFEAQIRTAIRRYANQIETDAELGKIFDQALDTIEDECVKMDLPFTKPESTPQKRQEELLKEKEAQINVLTTEIGFVLGEENISVEKFEELLPAVTYKLRQERINHQMVHAIAEFKRLKGGSDRWTLEEIGKLMGHEVEIKFNKAC